MRSFFQGSVIGDSVGTGDFSTWSRGLPLVIVEAAVVVVPEPTTIYQASFAELSNEAYLDWTTADYTSFLNTYYIIPEDAMSWMQSPYIYVFLDNEGQDVIVNSSDNIVVTSTGSVVVNSIASLIMNTVWDWSNTDEEETIVNSELITVIDSSGNIIVDDQTSVKASRDIQVYRYRNGYAINVSKNKIRGRGKVLQIRFTSESGLPFNLLGWAAWISKNSTF